MLLLGLPLEKFLPMSYCMYCEKLPPENPHRHYHDFEYGFALNSDNELFERLILEINQAGLSWDTILKKRPEFQSAYSQFDIEKIAAYSEEDRDRLMLNPGIIRNHLKINAAIFNAQTIMEIQKEFGSFKSWLEMHSFNEVKEWVTLFKKRFKFVGGEIVKEFLQSTGYLQNPHDRCCPIYEKIEEARKAE